MSFAKRSIPVMILFVLAFTPFFTAPITNAQSNPTAAACGLPAQGEIVATVTYTLTSNCQQTGRLHLNGILNGPTVKLTIVGNGYTIGLASNYNTAAPNNDLIQAFDDNGGTHVELRNLTLDLGNVNKFHSAVDLRDQFTLTNVTFRNVYGTQAARVGSGTLSNVLFENNYNPGLVGGSSPSGGGHAALEVFGTTTVNNGVFRSNMRGSSAIRSWNQGKVILTGCITFSGNVPYNTFGDVTNNSTGTCTGTIGNNDSAVIAAPSLLACGLPAPGNLDVSAIYTMKSDCDFSSYTAFGGLDKALWRIGDNASSPVKIKINGNNYTIKGGSAHANRIWVAGSAFLTIDNVTTDGVHIYNFGTQKVDFTEIKNIPVVNLQAGTSTYSNVHFNTNGTYLVYYYSGYGKGNVTIKDSKFSNWTRGSADTVRPIRDAGGTLTLSGCIVVDESSNPLYPANSTDITDTDADYTCNSPQFGPLPVPEVNVGPPLSDAPRPEICNPHCDEDDEVEEMGNCFARLGAIGVVCRPWIEPLISFISVWQVDDESVGHFRLKVMNPAVWSSDQEGMIASYMDGRAAVYVVGPHCTRRDEKGFPWLTDATCVEWQLRKVRAGEVEPLGWERFIVVAKGPNNSLENKTHVVYLDNAMSGRVIGTVDVWIGEPGVKALPPPDGEALPTFFQPQPVTVPFVTEQAAREDGSQWHVVGAGDTLHSIAVAYDISPWALADVNELEDEGRWLSIGQELLIRDAEAVLVAEAAAQRLTHVVKAGESLNKIAVRYRTTAVEIARVNGLANGGRFIVPGQKLFINDAA